MSGFVVSYGKPDMVRCEKMFVNITHRGPHRSGIFEHTPMLMAQNYLRADVGTEILAESVPVKVLEHEHRTICYDGQLGNCDTLAQELGMSAGPFLEERLLLKLYQHYGAEMLTYLKEGIFAFVISDDKHLFAARDLLGIKTLFYGWEGETLYLASELKCLAPELDEVYEFPPGHYMDARGQLTPFSTLEHLMPEELLAVDSDEMCRMIRDIIHRNIRQRLTFHVPVAGLLSGGLDSSVIALLASQWHQECKGADAKFHTFAFGVGESADIHNAHLMATHIGSEHHELVVTLEDALQVLPDVIYFLESFDPSLVRSSIANFLISRYAKEHGIEVLLSGEGGDENFCGYTCFHTIPLEDTPRQQLHCLELLHNNAALRLDRMNQCHSIRVVAPLISGELLAYAMTIPPEYKIRPVDGQRIEKWIFRKAFESDLPEVIAWRSKQEFSQGSGLAALLPDYFETVISDADFAAIQQQFPIIRSKEELYYFRLFTDRFGTGRAIDTVGQWMAL